MSEIKFLAYFARYDLYFLTTFDTLTLVELYRKIG